MSDPVGGVPVVRREGFEQAPDAAWPGVMVVRTCLCKADVTHA